MIDPPGVLAPLPELDTPRLVLRALVSQDVEDLFAFASDPRMASGGMWRAPRDLSEARAWLVQLTERSTEWRMVPWGIVHKASAKVIGTCGFIEWEPSRARAELAYALAPLYWNQGLMTEAVRAVIAFGLATMGLRRVEATCDEENVASWRVLEKVGMHHERTLRQFANGRYSERRLYSLLPPKGG